MKRCQMEKKKIVDQPLISVIVPVYKVENYLNRSVESIANQTYKNLDIILVDDGSPDCCGELCDQWSRRDRRIRVIHKMNGGLSDARNAAIPEVRGDYIGFVDSDDYIEPDMYEILLCSLLESDADISTCYAVEEEEDRPARGSRSGEYVVLDTNEALNDLLVTNKYLRHAAWNKLYRKEMFKSIRFPVGRLFEDAAIMYQIIDQVKTIACVNACLYHYVQRDGSISNSKYSRRSVLDRIANGMEAMDYFANRLELQIWAFLWNVKKFPDLWESAYANNDKVLCDTIICSLRDRSHELRLGVLRTKDRLKVVTFLNSPLTYCRIRRMWNKRAFRI